LHLSTISNPQRPHTIKMRKFVSAGLDKVFPRSSRTDPGGQYADPDNIDERFGRRTPNPLFSRRSAGYNDFDPTSHFGFPPEESNPLNLCAESRIFVRRISAASLSQLLIWYLYHDLIPNPHESSHRYEEMHRDLMVGWIRFGYELGQSTKKSKHEHLPRPLQEVIDTLGLDARDVCRKLARLGNEQSMRWHELAMYDLASGSSYLAAGDKLQSDYRMLQSLRPISATCWEKRQKAAMEWAQAYLALVIRPAVDLEAQPSQSFRIEDHDYNKDAVASSFGMLCTDFVNPPTQAIYHQAIGKIKWAYANDVLKAREAMAQTSGTSWFPSTSSFKIFGCRWQDRASEKNDRRQSAPMLDRQESALLSLQERMDLMEESVGAVLDDRNLGNSRYQQMQQTGDRGRSSRAGNHIDADEYRQSLLAVNQFHDIDDASRYSDDFESSQRPNPLPPSSAERPATSLGMGYPALPPFAYYPTNPRFQPSKGNENIPNSVVHDPTKRHGMILGENYMPLNSHPPHLTVGKGKGSHPPHLTEDEGKKREGTEEERERNDSSSNDAPPGSTFSSFGRPRDVNFDRGGARSRRPKRSVAFEDDQNSAPRGPQHLDASEEVLAAPAPAPATEIEAVPTVPERSEQRHVNGQTIVRIISPLAVMEPRHFERQASLVSPTSTPNEAGTSRSGSGDAADA
jgi:hypothetical protein